MRQLPSQTDFTNIFNKMHLSKAESNTQYLSYANISFRLESVLMGHESHLNIFL